MGMTRSRSSGTPKSASARRPRSECTTTRSQRPNSARQSVVFEAVRRGTMSCAVNTTGERGRKSQRSASAAPNHWTWRTSGFRVASLAIPTGCSSAFTASRSRDEPHPRRDGIEPLAGRVSVRGRDGPEAEARRDELDVGARPRERGRERAVVRRRVGGRVGEDDAHAENLRCLTPSHNHAGLRPQVSDTGQNPRVTFEEGSRAVPRSGAVRVPPGRQRRPSRPRDPGRDGRGRGAVARRGPRGPRAASSASSRCGRRSVRSSLRSSASSRLRWRSRRRRRTGATSSSPGSTSARRTRSSRRPTSTSGSSAPPRLRGARRRVPAGPRPHRRLGHASYAAPRALARPLDDRAGAAGARAEGADRAPDPRRRRPVRRDDPGRRARARLLHDLGSEVALRARRHRRPRRRRARTLSGWPGPATSPSRATSRTALSSRRPGQRASSRT